MNEYELLNKEIENIWHNGLMPVVENQQEIAEKLGEMYKKLYDLSVTVNKLVEERNEAIVLVENKMSYKKDNKTTNV